MLDPEYKTYIVYVGLDFQTPQAHWDQRLSYRPGRRLFKSPADTPILFVYKDGKLWLCVWGWPLKASTCCLGLRLYPPGRSVNSDRRRLLLAIYPKISRIAAKLTSMLKFSESTESTTRPGKGRVGVGSDGGDDGVGELTSMLRVSSSTESLTSATQIAVKYDEVDSGGGKSVKKSSKSQRIVKKSKNRQKVRKTSKAWKVAKVIGSEKHLPKHQSSVEELELPLELWQFLSSFCWA